MHMVGPYLTTTKYSGKGKKNSNTAKAREATAKHDAWLRKQGLHPEQRDLAKAFKGKHKIDLPNLKVESSVPLGNNIAVKGGFRNGIMDNLHNESEAVQQEIMEKASRTEVAYNKGPIMYHSPNVDRTQLGSRSRRG